MSNPSSSTVAAAMNSYTSLATLGHTITEKLSREFFLVWKAQVLPHIMAAGLMGTSTVPRGRP